MPTPQESLAEVLAPYEENPEKYSEKWRKASTDIAWAPLLDLFLPPVCHLADIAAGDGRDAQYFEQKGYHVTAVEPSKALRTLAQKLLGIDSRVTWVDDFLPLLTTIERDAFEMVTVCAGFVHIRPEDQKSSFLSLCEIVRKGGRIALSLRDGENDVQRKMYSTDSNNFMLWAEEIGIKILRAYNQYPDARGNAGVSWNYLMFERP